MDATPNPNSDPDRDPDAAADAEANTNAPASADPGGPESQAGDGVARTHPVAAQSVVETLRAADATVAVAEAHTGGALAARLVAVPGAGDVFEQGYVVYGRDAPRTVLGVSREALDDGGAVSPQVVRELAARARDRADTTWGVATTGVAGPTGGTAETPIGTTFVGVAYAAPWESGASFTRAHRCVVDGDRTAVIEGGVDRALVALDRAVRERADD